MFPHGIEGLIVIPTAIGLPGPKVGIPASGPDVRDNTVGYSGPGDELLIEGPNFFHINRIVAQSLIEEILKRINSLGYLVSFLINCVKGIGKERCIHRFIIIKSNPQIFQCMRQGKARLVGITIGLKNQIDSGKIPLGNEQGSVQYLSRTQKGQQNKTDDQPGSNRYFPLCPIILKY
jgi:hypothetical protein